MIPQFEGKNYKALGEVAEVVSGYAFRSSEFIDKGIPVIKIKNVRIGTTDLLEIDYVDEKYLDLQDRYHVHGGDILISLTGSHISQPNSVVGRVAQHSTNLPHCLLNQRVGKVIVKDHDACSLKYLFYALSEHSTLERIASLAYGAANQANISPKQVESIELLFPPLPIQHRIASILSAYDDLIENNQRRIRILEDMARSLYREWFVKFRFPGHEKVRMVSSSLGDIPEGWEVLNLEKLVEIKKGKNITESTIRPGEVPVVAGGINPAYFHDTPNTVHPVITISASGANAGFINLYHIAVWASDCSFIDSVATPHIYYYYLWLDQRRTEITRLQRGWAQPHVYSKDLAQLDAIAVPEQLLNIFAVQVTPIFELMMCLKTQIVNLRRTRDLLLPRLMSGQIELEGN